MSDITYIMNQMTNTDSAEAQLKAAIAEAGITPPDTIIMDGRIHRFYSGGKNKSAKNGWYICFGDGVPAGRFGDWRSDVNMTFRANVGRTLSAAEEMAHTKRLAESRILRDEEQKKYNAVVEYSIQKIWDEAGPASENHPYLQRKKIKPNGARITGDGRLIVPLRSADGSLSSLQYIDCDGGKLYHSGGITKCKYDILGAITDKCTIYIAEGFATAATIFEHTDAPCVIAYSASNIVSVAEVFRAVHGQNQKIVIVADNDESGVGQRYAEQACAKYGCNMIMPPIAGDANDYFLAGNDLFALLNPPSNGWLVDANDFCRKPEPVKWLIKNWIQDAALMMIHGPSGSGKTFLVLDMCLTLASGSGAWFGNLAKRANVIYLAGEGHHGLRGRIAAWLQYHKKKDVSMHISNSGCDLNTMAGLQQVCNSIDELKEKPNLIVVDTLHRFLAGDENSAQDAKTMLDACARLTHKYQCSVVLVHHTGLSEDAQHRARGSSSWRGALDIEINVVAGNKSEPMKIIQRKNKDGELVEPLYAELIKVDINGWIDDDGENVSSAVLIHSDQTDICKPSKMDGHKRMFENAWRYGGATIDSGLPYLKREDMVKYLINNLGYKERTAESYARPSGGNGSFIKILISAGVIKAHYEGWAVIDPPTATIMKITK